jgi:hypothetical protein
MIDRRTALLCTVLIALMLAAAVWRIAMLDDWSTFAIQYGRSATHLRVSWLLLFLFPAASALMLGSLSWRVRTAGVDAAKIRPWRQWAAFLLIPYCLGMLSLQGLLVVKSLGADAPFDVSAIGRIVAIVMVAIALAAINQMPKLPWLERRFAPGGRLGPIYGPRYVRTMSKMGILFLVTAIAWKLAMTPIMGWRSSIYVAVAAALVLAWSIAWRWHLGRKWRLEQSATH